MPADNKQSNAGCSSSSQRGCGCLMFIVFGFISIGCLNSEGPVSSDLLAPYLLCTLVGFILYFTGVWKDRTKKRSEKKYAKLFAEFKRDGMNEVVYKKIVQLLNHGTKRGQINVATALPEEIRRHNEVLSIRYSAILNRLRKTDSPALRSELLNVGRFLQELNSFNGEWSEQRLANDLATLSSAAVHSGGSVSIATQIAELGELCKKGIITREEFDRCKALFLGSPPDIATQTLGILDGLHKLKTNGALSESEYNVKKWELLGGKNLNPK